MNNNKRIDVINTLIKVKKKKKININVHSNIKQYNDIK